MNFQINILTMSSQKLLGNRPVTCLKNSIINASYSNLIASDIDVFHASIGSLHVSPKN